MKFWSVHRAYNLRDCMFKDWHFETSDPDTIDFIKNSPNYGILYKAEPEPGLLPIDLLGTEFTLNHPEAVPIPLSKVERDDARQRNIEKLEKPVEKLEFKKRELNPEQIMKQAAGDPDATYEDNSGQPFKDMKLAKMALGRKSKKNDGKHRTVVRNPNGPGFLLKVSK